jgi:hypothetical protein
VGLGAFEPQVSEISFQEWWCQVLSSVSTPNRKGLNSLIILGASTLWRHRNDCVFKGAAPCLATALVMAGEQLVTCNMVGEKGLATIPELGGELEG